MAKKRTWTDPINKHVDWAGDASTENLPVCGEMVQKFIRDTLEGKMGVMYYDPTANRYLVFADEENRDLYISDPTEYRELVMATFDAPFNYTAVVTLVDTQPVNYINVDQSGVYIKAYFDTLNKEGQSVGESVTVTIKIKAGTRTETVIRQCAYQALFSFNMDEYLSEGTNTVTIGITGNDTFAATTFTVVYYVMALSLTDEFDMASISHDGSDIDTLPIDYTIKGSGIKHLEWYIDGVQVPYEPLDDISVTELSRTKYISLALLAAGRHNLQYRAYIETGDGQRFYSDTIYHDFVIVGGSDKVIMASFRSPAANGIINAFAEAIPLYGLEQYKSKHIEFAMYDPQAAADNVLEIAFDGRTANFNTLNENSYSEDLKPYNSGNLQLVMSCGLTELVFNVPVAASNLDVAPISDTEFEMDGKARSNASADRDSYSSNGHAVTFTGFKWNDGSGWTGDGLLIDAGSRIDINYAPLAGNVTTRGITIEIEFESRKVLDDDAVICNLRTGSVGLLLTASEASLTSQGGVNVSTRYKSGENTRVSFIVNRLTGVTNKGLVFICVDGILAGAVPYVSGDSFVTDTMLSFAGSADANILLRQIRIYNRALSLREVENNFILYRPTVEQLLEAYDHNDIYESGSENLSLEKLSAQTPVIIVTGDMEALENATDKNTEVLMEKLEVINMDDPTRNMTLTDLIMRPQGTSSMSYPKKNFRFYSQRGSNTKMYDYQGREVTDRLYSFKNKAQRVKTWCLKADYAESSSTHNTGVARLWNEVLKNMRIENTDARYKAWRGNTLFPGETQAQEAARLNNYEFDVRTAIDGFPIVLFYHLHAEDPLIFLGKYNWNNDKSTESVFGFKDVPGFDNTNMECWEMLDSGLDISLFKTVATWDNNTVDSKGNHIKMWQRSFEGRYPDGSVNDTHLKAFATWVASTNGASHVVDGHVTVDDQVLMTKFSTEKWAHMDVYKMAAYYIYLMRFGGVDQVAKNAMLTSEDGIHYYFINYDNDTIFGVRNDGLLKFGYNIDRQSKDPSDPNSYCYAAHDSVLWNNLEADEEFMTIVKQVDDALYKAGLTYRNTIDMFNNKQSAKWSEKMHNLDSQFKYLDVWNDSGNNQLEKLQGSRSSHRKWWIAHRFAKFDALNFIGGYTNNYIEIKTDSSGAEQQTVKVTPSATGQIFGYGVKERAAFETGIVGTKNVEITFVTPTGFYFQIGNPIDFYNAAYLKKFDASAMASHIQQMFFEYINSDAEDSALEEIVLGNENLANVICTQLGGLSYAKYLKRLDIRNFQALTSLDLSHNIYLQELDARNCLALTGIVLPEAAPITTLRLPDALQTLTLKDLAALQTLAVEGYGAAINTFNISGCPTCPICTSFDFLRSWMSHRSSSVPANVTLDNVDWTFTDETELLAFINYIVESGGTYSLRGKATLTSIDAEGINAIYEVFGENAFRPNAAFRIVASGVFVVGDSQMKSGETRQYQLLNMSGQEGQIVWQLATAVSGISIDRETGVLTADENTSADRTVTVRGTLIVAGGGLQSDELTVTVKKLVYPASVSIQGDAQVEGEKTYTWTTPTEGINVDMTAEWVLSGDIFSYVSFKSRSLNSCVLRVDSEPMVATGTLTLTLKKASNGAILCTDTKSLSCQNSNIAFTSTTHPRLMALMYSKGFAAHSNYMEKWECALLTAADLQPGSSQASSIFYADSNFRSCNENMDVFQYFVGLTELPEYLFYECCFERITLPSTITTIRTRALCVTGQSGNTNKGLKSVKLLNTGTTTVESAGIALNGDQTIENDLYLAGENAICIIGTNPTVRFKGLLTSAANVGCVIQKSGWTQGDVTLHIEKCGLDCSAGSGAILGCNKVYVYSWALSETPNNQNRRNLVGSFASVYLYDTVIPDRSFYQTTYPAVYCQNEVTYIGDVKFFNNNGSRLYLLNNYHLPTTIAAAANYLGYNSIVVRHSLIDSYKTTWPTLAEKFTDDFVSEGEPVDFTVTGDDVIGQAIGTILHVSKLYNGHYADGTAGQEYIVEDMEQEDNFFPQNETNATIQRTFNVTIDGITKSCTINQNIKDTENVIKVIMGGSSSKNKDLFSSNYSVVNYTCYLNNKKCITQGRKINHDLAATDILLILPNVYINFRKQFSSCITNIREVDASCFKKSSSSSNDTISVYNQPIIEKITLSETARYYNNNFQNCPYLNEVICLSSITPNISNVSGPLFGSNAAEGVLKYPYTANYSNMIALLPSGWTSQDYDTLGSYANEYQVTADDCEATDTSTTVHIRKKYNVTEVDGTSGVRWIETTQQSATFAANTSSNPITHTGTYSDADIVSATYTFTQAGVSDFVNLGLPSGLKWRKMNLGATNPQDDGDYFSWGNIEGHAAGSGYTFNTTTYNSTTGAAISADLTSSNDAASVILGNGCRMPTKDEFQELYDNTDTEWVSNFEGTGVAGRKFMKKSDHSIFVFFPAAGYCDGTTLRYRGSYGVYLSSSYRSATSAYILNFSSSEVYPQNYNDRRLGISVRAVK